MPSYANTVMLDSECLEILRDKPAKKKSEYIRKAIKNYNLSESEKERQQEQKIEQKQKKKVEVILR
jgi:hypothetical protein